jgi:tRNA(fMet)-specific endonuclease VapC
MSLYILDTDILTLAQQSHPLVLQRVWSHAPSEVVTTILSIQEQLDGWHGHVNRARTAKKLAEVYKRFTDCVQFLAGLPILSFTENAISRFDQLRQLKLNIGKMDLRIAAIVLENNATLVSRNLRDFQRVPGLVVEDWSQ